MYPVGKGHAPSAHNYSKMATGRPEADPYNRTIDRHFVGTGLPDGPPVYTPNLSPTPPNAKHPQPELRVFLSLHLKYKPPG